MHISHILLVLLFLIPSVSQAQTLFWVGGSGDWHDAGNWSSSSGGFGGFGIPNSSTSVVFDQLSFAVPGDVITASSNLNCLDLDFRTVTNMPLFQVAPIDSLNIDGSLWLTPDMTWEVQSPVIFRDDQGGRQIDIAQHSFLNNVIFNSNSTGGQWTLENQITVDGNIYIVNGELDANGNDVRATSIRIPNNTNQVGLDISNAVVDLSATAPDTAKFFAANDNLIFDGVGGTVNLTSDQPCVTLSGDLSYSFGSVNIIGPDARLTSTNSAGNNIVFESLTFSMDALITGDHSMQTLIVSNQHTLSLENGSTQFVLDIQTSGPSCDGDARIVSQFNSGDRAIIEVVSSPPDINAPVFLRGIDGRPTNRTISVFGGFNGGNNSPNITFTGAARNLHWVGEGGDWNDANNWSRTEGGPGGECVPKSVDNVFFNNGSFPDGVGGDVVTSDLPIFLNSFTFTTDVFTGTVDLPALTIIADEGVGQGSEPAGITIDTDNLSWAVDTVFLLSSETPGMSGNTDNLTVRVVSNILNNVVIDGEDGSRVRLDTSLVINGDLLIGGDGEFNTLGNDVEANTIITTTTDVSLELAGSVLTAVGTFDGTTFPITIGDIQSINANNTTWILTADDTGISIGTDAAIGSVISQSSTGTTVLSSTADHSISLLQINNDGSFTGETYEIDSLVLTPDHTYELGAGVDITLVQYFEARGDLCFAVAIVSSGPGIVESITMDPSTELILSGLNITDVQATGGSSFFAGEFSEGSGDTSGWDFPTDQENRMAREYLGPNIAACSDSIIVLEPFTAAEITGIQWQLNGVDVSTDLEYQIDPSATEVIAIATTPSGCELRDTIDVAFSVAFSLVPIPDSSVCQGSQFLLDPGFSDPTASFIWSTGETTETILVDQTDTYTVEVDRGGCIERDTVMIRRIELEPFDQVFPIEDTIQLCEGEMQVFEAPNFSNSNFVWSDGTSTPTITATANNRPADDLYFIEVTEGACTDSDSVIVIFDSVIQQVLSNVGDTTVCEGVGAELSVVPGFDSLLWNTGATTESINIDVRNTMTYTVEVFRGACQETASREVTITPVTPVPLGGDVTICENETLEIIRPSGLTLPHVWIDSSTSTIITSDDTLVVPIVTGRSAFIIEALDGVCPSRDTIGVNIQVAPVFDLNTRDTTICIGEDITLTTVPEADVEYVWSIGDQTPSITVSTADTYVLTADRGVCTVDTAIVLDVLDLGAFSIGPADTTLCRGETLILDATLSGSSVVYDWTPATVGPIFNVITDGDYRVIATSGNCSVRDSITVAFDDPGIFDLHLIQGEVDTIICEGTTLSYPSFTFTDVVWSTLDGTEVSTNANVELSDPDTYELQVNEGVCVTRDTINLIVQLIPALALPSDVEACDGDEVRLGTPASANVSYLWSTTETTDSITVTTSNTFSVVADDGRCQNTASTDVIFNNIPAQVLAQDANICDGDSLLLYNGSDLISMGVGTSIQRPPGDMFSGDPLGDIFARVDGDYILTLSNTDNCTRIDTLTFTVNETPFFELPDSTGLCDGADREIGPTFVNGNSPAGAIFRWSNADGNERLVVRDVNQGQLWLDVMLDNADGTCFWSDTTFVDVQELPVVNLDAEATICSDSTLTLDATTPGVTYLWSTGETTPTIDITSAGPFSVVVDIKGCTDESETIVDVIQAPVVNLGQDTTVCEGDEIILSTGDASLTTLWSTGDTGESITVAEAGTFTVMVEDNGCTDADDITISTSVAPVFDLGEDLSICDQVGGVLSIDLSDVDILWSTGETTNSIQVNQEGVIEASVINSFGCESSDDVNVSFRDCQRFTLYRPNSFTLSAINEGNNRFFTTPSTGATINTFEMSIFNRWGNLVYSTNDITAGWDGLTNGSSANPGVYVYSITVNYTDDFDPSRTDVFQGEVTLFE